MKTVCMSTATLPTVSLAASTVHAPSSTTTFHAGPKFGSTKLAAAIFRGALTLVVLSTLLLVSDHSAQAQTETVLYNFNDGLDGAQPQSSLTFHNGNLYGTTLTGGSFGYGTVFELSPNGSGGWNETVLHMFVPGENDECCFPYSNVTFDSAGNFYGTTYSGTVFEMSPVGASWTITSLYDLYTGTPSHLYSGVIMDAAGNLYGTSYDYSGIPSGTVYELSPSPSGWTGKTIYSVKTGDSLGMYAGLAMDASGNIFGSSGNAVFELSPDGKGGWNSTVIHTFVHGTTDGFDAESTPVLDQAGNLFGTTAYGGANNNGAVYKLTRENGKWQESVLYSFPSTPVQGIYPWGGLVLDAAGNLYGTAMSGGLNSTYCQYTCGTVFELSPVGGGSYQQKTLLEFNYLDGSNPMGSLILDGAGNLYGTSASGGQVSNGLGGFEVSNHGVVFEVNPSEGVAPTATTLTSSPNPSIHRQAVTFTAMVTSNEGAPPNGETVSFMKGKTVLGTGTLSGGSASLTTAALKVGTTAVTAVYGGDAKFSASTSNTVEQVVNKASN